VRAKTELLRARRNYSGLVRTQTTLEAEHMDEKPCPYVTGTVTRYCTLTPFTLTDAEREAIREAADAYALDDLDSDCDRIAATLRGLLERTA